MISHSKICIASDSLLIGEALCNQLNVANENTINVFFYERELLDFIQCTKNALVILFSRLKDVGAFEILQKIKHINPKSKVVMIDSNMDRLKYLLSTQTELCKGILFHDIGAGELFHCLSEVANSRAYISSQVRLYQFKNDDSELINAVNSLSNREKEIFELIAEGYSSGQISNQLFISPTTINNHKTNLCAKLGVFRKNLHSTAIRYKNYITRVLN